ncbi:magnesium transporter [Orientia tsutsugamushi]|uniref:magnesium transporter n=1 Tax=Orientia tsutsugamushi TaxID=784 RepID=UPI00315D1879
MMVNQDGYNNIVLSKSPMDYNKIYNLIMHNDLAEVKLKLQNMHYADFVELFEQAPAKFHKKILDLAPDDLKKQALEGLSYDSRISIVEILGFRKTASLLQELETQDIIGFIEDLDDDIIQNIMAHLSADKKKYVIEGLTYPENTAGRVMEKQYVSLPEHWTVDQSINYVASYNTSKNFYAAIVVDAKQRPVGNLPLFKLLKCSPDCLINQVMNTDIKVDTHTDLNEVSYIFKHYELTIVPVVSKIGKLVGTISINNMLYILEEQAEEDIMQLAGVQKYSLFANVFSAAKHRLPWLFFNFITALTIAQTIAHFEETISKYILLASTMPIIASMGGNTGTQVMTITVMALTNKYINYSNFFKVFLREILICSFNGFLLALISFLCMMIMHNNLNFSIAFSATVIINTIIAGTLGFIIPITLHSIKLDPAAGSTVFLTALTDFIGYITFLYIAYVFLV